MFYLFWLVTKLGALTIDVLDRPLHSVVWTWILFSLSKMHGYLLSFHRTVWNDKEKTCWFSLVKLQFRDMGANWTARLPWQTPLSLKWALTEVHILKTASTLSCVWEAERHLTSLCRQTLVYSSASRIKRSEFNSIFCNSAKPKCPGYPGYGILFLKTAGLVKCNTKNRYWF